MKNNSKHFSSLTKEEVSGMIHHCKAAAINYAKMIGLGGLSEGYGEDRSHNIYLALEDAIYNEYAQAKKQAALHKTP